MDYSIPKLIKDGGLGWLEEVKLGDVSLDVVLPEQAEGDVKEEEPEAEKEPGEMDLAKLIGDLLEARYELTNIDVRVTRGTRFIGSKILDWFCHPAGKVSCRLGGWRFPRRNRVKGSPRMFKLHPRRSRWDPCECLIRSS